MATFYPRKQTVLIFVICIAAVATTAYYVSGQSSGATNTDSQTPTIAANVTASVKDAVTNTDWQKQFYDGSVAAGTKTTTKTNSTEKDAPLTATDALGREFLTKYMQMHQAGLTTDPTVVNNVATQLINDSLQNIQAPKNYELSSLSIIAATDSATLKFYSQRILAILNLYIPDQDHNEAVLASNALDNNDMTQLKLIDPAIANYRKALKALLAMKVPKPLAQNHLDLINGVNITLFNAISLRNLDADPVKGMAAIGLEMTGLQAMNNALIGMKQYFITAGVPFSA